MMVMRDANPPAHVKVACVGAGYFSRFHYDSWRRLENVSLTAACDRSIEKAQLTGLPAFKELDRMLTEHPPDLLDVILPPDSQVGAIRAALRHGVRWIICQKPFCGSFSEAQAVTREAEAVDATIVVHENFRFQPWYRAIKAELDRHTIGQVLQANFRLRPGDGQGPNAYLDRQPYFQNMPRFLVHETAVHWIDTFRFLFGLPSAVYADLRRVNPAIAGEDAGYILFDHPDGLRAMFDGNRCLDHAADNLRRTMGEAMIEGTNGVLTLHGSGSVSLRRFGESAAQTLLGPDQCEGFGGDCVHSLQSHVISGFLSQSRIENTAGDYLDVIRIEEAIYRSDAENRKIDLVSV